MALQVWLPLNGSIYNQGLADKAITPKNITYATGKLGNAATFAQSYILIKDTPLTGSISDFSFSFWVKLNNTTSTHCIYNGRSTVGGAIAVFIIGSQLRFDDGLQHNNLYTFKSNIWTHCCLTRDSKNIKIYINGSLINVVTSVDFNISITYATIGVSSVNSSEITTNFLQGQLNDFRIYDEPLSPKQVKLLSQGLVCHYPMGNIDGKIGGRNLLRNSQTLINYTMAEYLTDESANILIDENNNKLYT